MAATLNTTNKATTTYALLVIFTVHPDGDQHLDDQQAIRDEAQSWLESLDATVQGVNIRKGGGGLIGRSLGLGTAVVIFSVSTPCRRRVNGARDGLAPAAPVSPSAVLTAGDSAREALHRTVWLGRVHAVM